MIGFEISVIKKEHVTLEEGGLRDKTIGQHLDEQIKERIKSGEFVQSIEVHFSEEDWGRLTHRFHTNEGIVGNNRKAVAAAR